MNKNVVNVVLPFTYETSILGLVLDMAQSPRVINIQCRNYSIVINDPTNC